MEKIDNISVKKILWDRELTNSRLEFNIKGNNINNVIVNTYKRVGTSKVPIYTFTNTDITKNTSVYNNNYLKLRLKNLPVIGIKTEKDIFIPKKNKNQIEEEEIGFINIDDINMNVNEDVNVSSLDKLTMYLEYENNSDEIVSVGTDDCKFYLKEKQIKSPYPTNVQLVKLQPKQIIKFSAITELGIEDISSIFSPVSIFTFRENSENDYDVFLESRGQLNEMEILRITYVNIMNDLDQIEKLLPEDNILEGKLTLNNIDHTLGNILSEGLQKHSNVIFAGYNMPHPLDTKIVLHFKLSKGNLKSIIIEVIEYYKKVFKLVNDNISKI
jgi:DNA-directed RNA polymerase subunit L